MEMEMESHGSVSVMKKAVSANNYRPIFVACALLSVRSELNSLNKLRLAGASQKRRKGWAA